MTVATTLPPLYNISRKREAPRPLDLRASFGANDVTRTHDLLITNQLLYRLSYISLSIHDMVFLERHIQNRIYFIIFFWFPATLSAWQFLYITFCILKEFLQNIFRRLAYFLRFSPEFRPLQQEILLWFSQETSTNSVIIFCWLPSFCSLPFFSAFT